MVSCWHAMVVLVHECACVCVPRDNRHAIGTLSFIMRQVTIPFSVLFFPVAMHFTLSRIVH